MKQITRLILGAHCICLAGCHTYGRYSPDIQRVAVTDIRRNEYGSKVEYESNSDLVVLKDAFRRGEVINKLPATASEKQLLAAVAKAMYGKWLIEEKKRLRQTPKFRAQIDRINQKTSSRIVKAHKDLGLEPPKEPLETISTTPPTPKVGEKKAAGLTPEQKLANTLEKEKQIHTELLNGVERQIDTQARKNLVSRTKIEVDDNGKILEAEIDISQVGPTLRNSYKLGEPSPERGKIDVVTIDGKPLKVMATNSDF